MLRKLAWLIAVVASFAGAASAGGFSGVVRDLAGHAVPGAWVEIRHAASGALDARAFDGPPHASLRTGADGAWSFAGLEAGTWIVSAVAGGAAATDAELEQLARPLSGATITRIIRRLDSPDETLPHVVDLALALQSSTKLPLKGRLLGAFAPSRYGYEITVGIPAPAGLPEPANSSATRTVTITSGDKTFPITTVPNADGTFDFGQLDVGAEDSFTVDAFLLDGPEQAKTAVFQGYSLDDDRPAGEVVEVPLQGHAAVALHVEAPESAAGGQATLNVWGEHTTSTSMLGADARHVALLTEGTYLARASAAGLASPLTSFRVPGAESPIQVSLVMQACPTFAVTFTDPSGAPLGLGYVRLGPQSFADDPEPCRVPSLCTGGVVEFKDLLPGSYVVEFKVKKKKMEPFRQVLELKPDAPPVVVTMP